MRGTVLLLLVILALGVRSQDVGHSAVLRKLVARDHAIDSLYKAEEYDRVLVAIEAQLKDAEGTTWVDSVYRYCYEYGRALWKTSTADLGLAGANAFYERNARADPAPLHRIEMLADLSWLYYDLGQPLGAIRVDSLAIAVADAAHGLSAVVRGKTRQYMGFDQTALGNHKKAAHYYLEAASIYEAADSVPALALAESCNGVGSSYWHLGRTKEAEAYYLRSLDLLGEATDMTSISRQATTYGNLGIMWQSTGDLVRSKEYYQRNISLNTKVAATAEEPSGRDEAIMNRSRTYGNLAALYHSLGEYATSRHYVDLAYADRSSVLDPDDPRLMYIQQLYAELALAEGDYKKAEELETGNLRSSIDHYGWNSEYTARSLSIMAYLASKNGNAARADSLYAQCIAVQHVVADGPTDPGLARIHMERAEQYIAQQRYREAVQDLLVARRQFELIHGAGHRKLAQCDILLSEAYSALGEMDSAEASVLSAIETLRDRRPSADRPFPRTEVLPHLLPDAIYRKTMIARKKQDGGKETSGSRATTLLADLDEAILALNLNKTALHDEESQLLLLGAQRNTFKLARTIAVEQYERDGGEQWKNKVFELSERDRTILLKNRLNEITSMSFSNVPDSILEREAQLIEATAPDEDQPSGTADGEGAYVDHAEEQAVFLQELQKTYPAYFELRYGQRSYGIADVQKHLLSPEQSLIAYSKGDSSLFITVIEKDRSELVRIPEAGTGELVIKLNEAVSARDQDAFLELAYQLYERVVAPVIPLLKNSELLIIPDDELYYLNFEALLNAPCTAKDFKQHLLINDFTISYLLSASTAIQFKQLQRERGEGALALAPGFSDALKSSYISTVKDSNNIDRVFLSNIQQPFAVLTAQGLSNTLSAKVMVAEDANEGNFKSMAGNYGIIHLGTHTEINNASPLYSKLVLSKSNDNTGEDGYLHAYEIYKLQLRAELAVLTACETGTGKKYDGEGVRSLAHSFAYAGCPSLVMSLWKIDEKVSSAITTRFYELLAQGLPKNVALRQAKLDHLRTAKDELALPYYWAGMVLVGDVAPIANLHPGMPWWQWTLIGLGCLLLVLFIRSRFR